MFSTIGGMFGMTSVEERDGVVHVYGIRTDHLIRDIEKIWKTSLITKYMFNTLGSSSHLTFNSFFAPDFYYTLTEVLKYRYKFSSTSKLERILKLLIEKTWLQSTVQTYPSIVDLTQLQKFVDEPLPHQLQYITRYDQNIQRMRLKGMLCAAEPGTGKFRCRTVCSMGEG